MTAAPVNPALAASSRHRGWSLPLAVLAAGLGATFALAAWSLHVNAVQNRALFERHAETFSRALSNRVQSYVDTIPGLRLTGARGQHLTEAEFTSYVQAVSLAQRFPGLTLSFIADLVTDAERAAYVAAARADRSVASAGHPGFDIQPPGQRAAYMVLRHAHPAGQSPLGYDLFDPTQSYRAEIEAAIDSGRYVATAPLQLAQDRLAPRRAELTSVVVRVARYAGGATPDNPEARRAAAIGVVGIAFRAEPLVRGVMPAELAQMARVRVVDLDAERDGLHALVFDSDAAPAPATDAALQAAPLRFAMAVGDRHWQLQVLPRPAALQAAADITTWVLLALGLVTSLSLTAMTRTLTRAQHIADARIREGTAQLQAEKEQLAHSESRYRMLFENSFDAVLRTRPDGAILAANPAACALLGMTQSQLLAAGRDSVVDRDDPRLAELMARRARDGRAQGAITMQRADGSHFEAEVSSSLYLDADGHTAASLIVRDLSTSQRAAAERQRLEAQLRHAQKMEAVGTLAGGIAHDFNNVLAVVLGNAAMVQQDLGPAHPAAPAMELIVQASLRARSLVQQILAFSRPQSEHRQPQLLRPLVEEAIKLLRVTLPAGVQLEAALSDAPLAVVTDATQVQQVVINLCNNAWQAMPGHQGHIVVTLARADVDAAAGAAPPGPGAGRYARLSVRDDGAGMSEATRSRIFEPFFTTKPVGRGTGLGLAVVHGIVSGHGGAITVDSAPGAGARFDVYLPLADVLPPARPAGEPGATPAARGQGQRVMVIDDDEVVSLTVAALLERLGYRVDCQADPKAALAVLAARPAAVDLVVTDFNMPGLSGLDVAAAVLRIRADLPVIITTGHVTDELLAEARGLGVARVMFKEYTLEHLGGIVAELLAARVRATLG